MTNLNTFKMQDETPEETPETPKTETPETETPAEETPEETPKTEE